MSKDRRITELEDKLHARRVSAGGNTDRLGAWIGVGLCLLSASISVAGLYLVAGWFL